MVNNPWQMVFGVIFVDNAILVIVLINTLSIAAVPNLMVEITFDLKRLILSSRQRASKTIVIAIISIQQTTWIESLKLHQSVSFNRLNLQIRSHRESLRLN